MKLSGCTTTCFAFSVAISIACYLISTTFNGQGEDAAIFGMLWLAGSGITFLLGCAFGCVSFGMWLVNRNK